MTRFVIDPGVALRLAAEETIIPAAHQLVAPTLLRSQTLSLLYQAVRRGELTRAAAERRLNYLRGLRMRLLGDRVLQAVAWTIADQLDWPDTLVAEYVALTRLQADAFVTLDPELAKAVGNLVTVASIDVLVTSGTPRPPASAKGQPGSALSRPRGGGSQSGSPGRRSRR